MKSIAVLVLSSAVNVPILKLFIYIWYIMDKFEEIMSKISVMGVIRHERCQAFQQRQRHLERPQSPL
jgi:hypothetical protein